SFPGTGRADRSRQQSTGTGAWHIATAMSGACVTGTCGDYASFLQRSITGRGGWPQIMPYDWEIRFEDGAFGVDWWTSGIFTEVPFSVWRTGISTPDDTSDDVRYIAVWLDDNGNGVFDMIANDHDSSGGANDPYTDWIYVYSPNDMSAGQSGYDTWLATAQSEGSDGGSTWGSENPMGRLVFYGWNHGDVSDGTLDAVAAQDRMPEAGTVFRFSTTKPNQPADVFSFSTDGLGAQARDEGQQIAALDDIGIVPNPYKGASSYEVSQLVDQVRFTNMPDQATIRIFTLAGTLVRTLEKNSASAMFPWDLSTEDNLPIASGMYIIHIETNIEGKTQEKVLKFGVVKKRVQLNAY
ncbi:MAG: T9SS type A sorting domain-containing protein, partial [Bacteroidetes Order II. Incertae sedis bacterium]|nr:T9SS type A sorting domain-containing protein [Bacteroidetes Order II. bacterium]